MTCPALSALELELCGDDGEARPGLAEAAAACGRGEVRAARTADGVDVAVCVLEDGRVFALPDVCPHDGGRLSDGFVEAGRLVCARHGWELDPATGERVWPPRRGVGVAAAV